MRTPSTAILVAATLTLGLSACATKSHSHLDQKTGRSADENRSPLDLTSIDPTFRPEDLIARRDPLAPGFVAGPTRAGHGEDNGLAAAGLPADVLAALASPVGWKESLLITDQFSFAGQSLKVDELVFGEPIASNRTPTLMLTGTVQRPWVLVAARKLVVLDARAGASLRREPPSAPMPPPPAAAGPDGAMAGLDSAAQPGGSGSSGFPGRDGHRGVNTLYLVVGEIEIAGDKRPYAGLPPTIQHTNYGSYELGYSTTYPIRLILIGGTGGDGGTGGAGGNGGRGINGRSSVEGILPFDCASGPKDGTNGGDAGQGGRGGAAGSGGRGMDLIMVGPDLAIDHLQRAFVNLMGGSPGHPGESGVPGNPGRGGSGGKASFPCKGQGSDGAPGAYARSGESGSSGIKGPDGSATLLRRDVTEWFPPR